MLTTTNTVLLDALADPGNEEVWAEFHERYQPILLSFAQRFGLEDADGRDAAQDALVRFVEEYRAGRYERDRGRLRSWLFAIARSKILDGQRERSRRTDWRGESALDRLPADDEELECAWDEEWRQAVLAQAFREVREATRTDPRTLRAFELLVLEERSAGDVAGELEMSVGAVYVAKHRTLERMREAMSFLETSF